MRGAGLCGERSKEPRCGVALYGAEVFRQIPEGEYANPNIFCHYRWEGIGAFALWKYATAYYDSA